MSVTGYSLPSYGRMIACEPRMSSYAEALRRSVTPGCGVIDLGAGPGLFSLLACAYGAGRVVTIEPDASIEVAKQAAHDNGFSDRITFVRDTSQNWTTEDKADVLVSDIRGVLPLFEHHIPTMKDVRARLLKPGGVQIPAIDHVYAALVAAPDTYAERWGVWLDRPHGIDMSAAHVYSVNSWSRVCLPPEDLLSDPQLFATIDYRTVEDETFRRSITFDVNTSGTAHGILMWFDSELVPGVGFSNAPGQPEQVYGQAFFPLELPMNLKEGAVASADISANFVDGDYVWSWNFRATDAEGHTQAFRQSTFKSAILSPGMLAPRAASFCPPAQVAQEIDMFCVSRFDGKTDLNRIAAQLVSEFPKEFTTASKALSHVANLSAKYNKY